MKKHIIKGITLSAGILAGTAAAVPAQTPPGLSDLPPGRVKEKIDKLPAQAQVRAIEWLERFNIPAEDFSTLDIDSEGGVFYVEPAMEEITADTFDDSSASSVADITEQEAFSLHSKPGASRIIYLDFDGHYLSGTAWNGSGIAYEAAPYDRDGNLQSFSQSELSDIAAIWHRIAEDFAGFNVDVTTEEPASMGPQVGRILITKNTDMNGNAMPSSGAGGVAYVGVWGRSNYTYYQPALVYYNNLGGGVPRYVVEAASHEMGHNLGLSHDGTLSGSPYFGGHGSGLTSWGPIMGTGYNRHVSQWSKGAYADANNQQDDIAIISNALGSSADDHGDLPSSASLLVIDGAGNVSSTNPELDLFNYYTDNKGVIETATDVDVFQINAGNGSIDLTINPAWEAYLDNYARGANLDIQARLLDGSGNVIQTSNPVDDTYARIQANVSAGMYFLEITGVGRGDAATSYDAYGSQGMYFISGSVSAGVSDNLPPNAQNDSAVTEEESAVVVYPLGNDSDPDGDSLFISSASNGSKGSTLTDGSSIIYTPSANQSGADSFSYTVSDGRGGFDTATVTVNITPVNDAPVARADSASTEQDTSVTISVLANDTDPDGDSLTLVSASGASNGSLVVSGSSVVYSPNAGFVGSDSFTYQVRDASGLTSSATVSVSVTQKVEPPVAPSGLSAIDGTNGTAVLSWADTASETWYEIQRESLHKKRATWVGTSTVASPAVDATAYIDASGTGTYRYRIRSGNSVGLSSWSNWVEVTVTSASGGSGGGKGGKGRK